MNSKFCNFCALLGLFFMAISWLVPNKAYPWLPAWNEGMAFASIFVVWGAAALHHRSDAKSSSIGISWPLLIFLTLAIFTAVIQYIFGIIIFSGDVFVIFLYFATCLIAIHAGSMIAALDCGRAWFVGFSFAVVVAAVLSVCFALVQWTKVWEIAIFILETDFGDRPGANIGQTNNLNTLFFVALCCALFLRKSNEIGSAVFILLGVFLTWGMAMTQSRTGLLQMLVVVGVCIFAEKSIKKNVHTIFCVIVYCGFFEVFPLLQRKMLLFADVGREFSIGDVRFTMWSALLEASWFRPWGGYGWLQTGWAQQVTAESHPILRTYMSYSHNLILDLIIWTGWPLGILLASLIAYWFWWQFLYFRKESAALYLYVAVLGVFIHGLLEYPLAYAYFLMPVGLIMGYLDGLRSVLKKIYVNVRLLGVMVLITGSLYLVVCFEYIQAVSFDVFVRMQTAKIGKNTVVEEYFPNFLVLNQLAAMYTVRVMSEEDYLDAKNVLLMGKVAQRYPYSPALFQYAQAAAMQGDWSNAEKQLRVLCGIYSVAHCNVVSKRWAYLQLKYPSTVGRVDWPQK